jgi:cytochrome c biogenesis protein
MQPTRVDGSDVFLTGMRDTPDGPFRYLRIPADDNDSLDEWMRLRSALLDPQMRLLAAQRYALRALPDARNDSTKLRQQLIESTEKGLSIFAGNGPVMGGVKKGAKQTDHQGGTGTVARVQTGVIQETGYVAVQKFLERLPASEQEKAADVFMKILNGSLWNLWQVVRERDGLPPIEMNEKHARFLQLATNAYSDTAFYGAPVYLRLTGFTEIKASVLQVTRSPGKNIVYIGCLFLVLGVFSMLYVRERRVWIWIKSGLGGQSHALMAMSSQRKTLDFEKEFTNLKGALSQSQ